MCYKCHIKVSFSFMWIQHVMRWCKCDESIYRQAYHKMNIIVFLNFTERKTNFAAKSITMICSPAVFKGIKRPIFNTNEMGWEKRQDLLYVYNNFLGILSLFCFLYVFFLIYSCICTYVAPHLSQLFRGTSREKWGLLRE